MDCGFVRTATWGKTREKHSNYSAFLQIVFNPCTYPNFLRFLKHYPTIPIAPTEMTFSVSRDHGQFEWAGDTIFTIFCQPWRLIDPSMWRMLYDVLRFNASAQRLVGRWNNGAVDVTELSIGEYLDREGYSESFRDNYLIVGGSITRWVLCL